MFQLTGNNPPSRENFYEVMIFVHGEDYAAGDAMMYAGHILARKEIIVITFNYRLGALGKQASLYCILSRNSLQLFVGLCTY